MSRLDHQRDLTQQLESPREIEIGEVIAHLSTLASCADQAAAAKACEMVGDVGAALPHLVGEFGGICRTLDQPNKDLPSNSVGHRGANTAERVEPTVEAEISCHDEEHSSVLAVVHQLLYLSERSQVNR